MEQLLAGEARRDALVVDGRQVAGSGDVAALWSACEERVTVRGARSVEWSAEGVLRKKLTTPQAISQAAWVRMHGEAARSSLALLHAHGLTLAAINGDTHEMPLPFTCSRLWPLPIGLLLQPLHFLHSLPAQTHAFPPSTPLPVHPLSPFPSAPFPASSPFAFPIPTAATAPFPSPASPIPFPALSPHTPAINSSLPAQAAAATAGAGGAAGGQAGRAGGGAMGGTDWADGAVGGAHMGGAHLGGAHLGGADMGGPYMEAGCFTLLHAHDELQPSVTPSDPLFLVLSLLINTPLFTTLPCTPLDTLPLSPRSPLFQPVAMEGTSPWQQGGSEEVLWSSTEVPLLATFNHARRQHSVWHLRYLPQRFLHQSSGAPSAAEQDPLIAGLSPVSPATAAGRAEGVMGTGGVRGAGQEGVVAGRGGGGGGGDAGMVGDLRLQAGRGDVGGSVGSGDRRGRGGGRGGAAGVAAAAKLSRFAGGGGGGGPGGGVGGRAAGGQAGSGRGSMEGQTGGGGVGERGGDGGEGRAGGERWDAEGEGGGWCVRMTRVWTGLTGQDKASHVLLLSHTPLSSSPPGPSSSCPHHTSLPAAIAPLLSPSPPRGSASLAFCTPASQRVWVRHVAYGGPGEVQGEGGAEEEESRADEKGGSGRGGDEGRGRVVHMEGRRCWSVEAVSAVAEHRFQVKLAVAAHLPARCLAAIRASPFPRRLSHDLRCALLAPRLWRLQQQQRRGEHKAGERVERGGGAGEGRRVELVKLCTLVGAADGDADDAEGGEGEEWCTLLGVVEEWIEAALVGGGARTGTGKQDKERERKQEGEREGEQGAEAMEVDGEGDTGSAGRGAQGGAGQGSQAAAGGEGGSEAGQSAWEGLLGSQHHRHLLLAGAPPWMPFPLPSPPTTVHAAPARPGAATTAATPSMPGGERGADGEGVQVGGEWGEGGEGVGVGELVEVLWALHGVYEESRLDALCRSSLPALAALVWVLAAVLGAHDLCDHYQRHHPALALLACSFPPILSERALPPHPALPSVVPCVFTWLARTAQFGPSHAAPWLAWMPPSLLSTAALPTLGSAGQAAEGVVGGEMDGRGREARGGRGAREGRGVQEGGEWWEKWESEGEGGTGLLPLVVALFSLLFPHGDWTRPAARPTARAPPKARHKAAVGEGAPGGGKASTDKGGKGGAEGDEGRGGAAAVAGWGDGVGGMSERCVAAMVAARMGRSDLQRLPPAVALPLLQVSSFPCHHPFLRSSSSLFLSSQILSIALHVCRESPPPGWPAAAYVLVGRDDLAATATACLRCFSLRHSSLPRCPSPHSHLSGAAEGTTATTELCTTAVPHSLSPPAFSFPPTVLVRPLSPFPSSPHPSLHPSLALPGSHTTQGLASASGVGVGGMGAGAGSGMGVGGASDAAGVGGGGAGVEGAGGEGMVADGMEHLLLPPARSLLALRFPCDLRLAEALSVPKLVLAGRLMAQNDATVGGTGQGMHGPGSGLLDPAALMLLRSITVTFNSSIPLSTNASHSPLQVGLDGSLGNLSELATWPEFHNGVAAGLKLAREASSAHGGLLMALGLRGHLRVLAPTDFFRDLALEHEATTVGVLLGAAASYRATMDANICKMLYLHIPSRHPPSFPDLELPPSIQVRLPWLSSHPSAALLLPSTVPPPPLHVSIPTSMPNLLHPPLAALCSLHPPAPLSAPWHGADGSAGGGGAAAHGSLLAHSSPQSLLAHSSPQSLLAHSSPQSLLAHSSPQSLLAHSSPQSLLAHSSPQSLLAHSSPQSLLAHSSPQSLLAHSSPQSLLAYSSPQSLLAHLISSSSFPQLFLRNRCHPHVSHFPLTPSHLLLPSPQQQGQQGVAGQAEWSWGGGGAAGDKPGGMGQWPGATASSTGHVLEGNTPNVDVTAPGAILALAMMYLQSNNEAVAARLAPPATHFALEFVRPDFILLRVLACSLILWDRAGHGASRHVSIDPHTFTPPTFAPPPTATPSLLSHLHPPTLCFSRCLHSTSSCVCLHSLFPSPISVPFPFPHTGLRYAGSANGEAEKLLRSYALLFFFLRERRPVTAVGCPFAVPLQHWRALLDARTLDTAVNAAVLSLSLVMAGTGHLPSLRLLLFFHRRTAAAADAAAVNAATTYGSHMAVSMAIGFLALSACQATFSTSPPAVAALLLALFPHFPSSPSDHRCHLQALRHFWVLAVEERAFVEAVDVDTWQPVIAPLRLTLKPSDSSTPTTLSLHTPCLLPPLPQLRELRLCGRNFWPLRVAARIA
ncbi:unnamed protein product, partial [Closterium sp. Yama58-4]